MQLRESGQTNIRIGDGFTQQVVTRGNGCAVGDEYIAVVDRSGVKALVAYRNGDLDVTRVIAAPFEPLGEPADYFLETCGRYGDQLLFVVERPQRKLVGDAGRVVVITDPEGNPLRSIELEFDLDGFLSRSEAVATKFGDRSSLSGELTRFAPVIQYAPGKVHRELAILDLEAGMVSNRFPLREHVWTTLFRDGHRWYVSNMVLGRAMELTVIDGQNGQVVSQTRVGAVGPRGGVENPLLPSHVAAGKLWISIHNDAPIHEPPIAILSSDRLEPLYLSRHVELRSSN